MPTQKLGSRIVLAIVAACLGSVFVLPAATASAQLEACVADPVKCVDLPGSTDDEVVDKVEETTKETKDNVEATVKKTIEDPDETISNPEEPIKKTVDDIFDDHSQTTGGGTEPKRKKAKSAGAPAPDEEPATTIFPDRTYSPSRLSALDAALAFLRQDKIRGDPVVRPAAFLEPGDDSLDLSEALERFGDAAKTFAFPMVLVGLVAAFLVIQARVDHRDPKLAMAPVSAEQDYLSFT